jgi:predicted PurR-regulated permease PerM
MLVGGLRVFAQARTLWTDMSQDGGVIDQIDVRLHNGIEQSSQFLSRFGVDLSAPAEGDQPRGLRELWTQVQHLTSAQDVDMSSAGKAGMKAAGGALTFVRGLFGGLLSLGTLLFLLPIYTYFLLFELDRIHGFVIDLVP